MSDTTSRSADFDHVDLDSIPEGADGGWSDRVDNGAADYTPGDSVEPHDGKTTDLNVHAGDLDADPDPAYDPMRST